MSATDTSFESAFSEIAHTVLRDTAPALMEHLVGFQILDKDDSDSRAVGVFGFKINNQWFYAPVFFLNGALKGTDLLYVKEQDLFIPLQDNWISYLLSKKPQYLGTPEPKDESELNLSVPRFNDFAESPSTNSFKWASVKTKYAAWAEGFIPAYTEAVLDKKAFDPTPLSLDEALKRSPEMAASLAESMQGNTKLAEAVLEYYGNLDFLPPANTFVDRTKKATDDGGKFDFLKASAEGDTTITDTAPTTVKAYTIEDVPEVIKGEGGSAVLTEAEKEDLMRGEVVIKDNRPEESKSRVYDADFERKLQNPTETGVYRVLTQNGDFVEALVITDPRTIGDGRTGGVSIVITEDASNTVHTSDVFVTSAENEVKGFSDNYKKFYDKGVGADGLKYKHYYVAVNPSGIATIPFIAGDVTTSNDGTKSIEVTTQDTCVASPGKRDWSYLDNGYDTTNFGIELAGDWDRPKRNILVTPKAIRNDMQSSGSTLVATDNVKYIDLGYDKSEVCCIGEADDPEPTGKIREKFCPGNLVNAEKFIMKSGAYQVDVFTTGSDVVLRHEFGTKRLKKHAAIKELVVGMGLGAEDANKIVKSASKTISQYWVKSAEPMSATQGAPAFPAYATGYDSDLGATTVEQQQDFVPVDGMEEPGGARDEYDLMRDPEVQKVLQAAKTGKKEVFDTTVVGNLVKLVDVDGMVDSFLPDIIRGMDRIGRILFMFYWHADSFKERYGRQEVINLEDSLRNVFKSTGDLIIFLKQQSVTPDVFEESMSVDIGELA